MASTANTVTHAGLNGHAENYESNNGTPSTPSKEQMRSIRSGTNKYKHTFAVHVESRASCLSPDSPTPLSFIGFRNLMALALIGSNLRLMIENFRKYGLLVTLSGAEVPQQDWRWTWILFALTPCHLFLAYLIEAAAARYAQSVVATSKKHDEHKEQARARPHKKEYFSTWRMIAFCHASNATFMLVFATHTVYYRMHNPGLGAFAELHAVIVWLKVCSYAFTNRDLCHAFVNPDPAGHALPGLYKSCPYPRNVTLRNLCYFWLAPTLVYQPVYPRTNKIRWDFVAKRLGEIFLLSVVVWLACAQYAVPLLQNSLDDISNLNLVNMLERTLKLSTISLVCWLAGFFALFQSFLNLLAELMYFGDREFYSDWWNSSDLRGYWVSWNKPVTHHLARHIYSPMVGRGVPRPVAQFITFVFSGILHELLIGIPTHNILGVAFFGMISQIPLIYLTDFLSKMKGQNGKLLGNCVFWVSFCLFGQPIAALAYFFAWQAKFGTNNRPEWPVAWGDGKS